MNPDPSPVRTGHTVLATSPGRPRSTATKRPRRAGLWVAVFVAIGSLSIVVPVLCTGLKVRVNLERAEVQPRDGLKVNRAVSIATSLIAACRPKGDEDCAKAIGSDSAADSLRGSLEQFTRDHGPIWGVVTQVYIDDPGRDRSCLRSHLVFESTRIAFAFVFKRTDENWALGGVGPTAEAPQWCRNS